MHKHELILSLWYFLTGRCSITESTAFPSRPGRPGPIRSSRQWSVCLCVCAIDECSSFFSLQLYIEGERLSHTLCLTPSRSACCTHLQRSSRHMPAAHTGCGALPTAAARALNLMVSKYSRNQADNETRYALPSMPCTSSSQGLLLLTQEMHYWETFSLTLSLPLILLFLLGPRSASRQGRMPTSPQSRAECPHPLCKCFTTSPAHTFILCPPPSPTPPFLHLFLSPLTPQSFSNTFFSFLSPALLLHFNHRPAFFFFFFCCFTPSRLPNCMCTFYLNCYPSSSISPLRSHSLLSLWNSLSPPFPAASLTHCLTHPDSNLYTHSSASARQASAETPFPLSPSFSVSFTLSRSLVHTVTHARVYFP